ncbi:hypothetical protein ACJX0J_032222, partial [Zea mays]
RIQGQSGYSDDIQMHKGHWHWDGNSAIKEEGIIRNTLLHKIHYISQAAMTFVCIDLQLRSLLVKKNILSLKGLKRKRWLPEDCLLTITSMVENVHVDIFSLFCATLLKRTKGKKTTANTKSWIRRPIYLNKSYLSFFFTDYHRSLYFEINRSRLILFFKLIAEIELADYECGDLF